MSFKKTFAIAAFASVVAAGAAEARDQIRIVGSSTVYPFATSVAETFGKSTSFKTPVIESTGSGGGFKLFCAGVGEEHPDITNASRAVKSSEIERCAKNGVDKITEVKVGYDGIVLANSKKGDQLKITRKQIFLALAKDVPNAEGKLVPNPYKKWSEIDSSLPATKIEVLGPPPTSGTRDAFAELALEGGCKKFPMIKAMKKGDEKMGIKKDKKKYKAICHSVREDGAYIDAGENDNLIIQKLNANPKAYGVFGFSFLDQNSDSVQGSVIDGKLPEFELIANGSYPVSRPLFFYVKNAHIGSVPGILEYLAEFTADKAWGDEGYLTDKGLIPMPVEERAKYKANVKALGAGS
ncbi:Phosphate ABC transporter substrate-binding protein [Candidatus Terasakiella magnetica]|uniref:Phosphate ABC transporter substrate-binding protein n=1 Tax=Candidatus Terasakiella magnetica TaxID=1867952 RepID=A0A1C3RC95_9PROT|nr:PstS family phosphate ABC transporter substrate-binding protein [Candidatus Terasakiella magnetica]SCA54890.1 Phosphate ABC transporter substrate-binding protein [Candidatus Terasakiella magnetica]